MRFRPTVDGLEPRWAADTAIGAIVGGMIMVGTGVAGMTGGGAVAPTGGAVGASAGGAAAIIYVMQTAK